MEIRRVNLRIHFERGKIQARKTPSLDTFHAVQQSRVIIQFLYNMHCVKSVHARSYSGPHLPTFGLNMERYEASLRSQSECGKIWTRITPNTDTFHAVIVLK